MSKGCHTFCSDCHGKCWPVISSLPCNFIAETDLIRVYAVTVDVIASTATVSITNLVAIAVV